jgi:hypothetical protein
MLRCQRIPIVVVIGRAAVEKLNFQEFAKITLRQDALQTTSSAREDRAWFCVSLSYRYRFAGLLLLPNSGLPARALWNFAS